MAPEIILIELDLSSNLFLKKSGSVIASPAFSVYTRSRGAIMQLHMDQCFYRPAYIH